MITYARAIRKRTWHIVTGEEMRPDGGWYKITVCGEPSIGDAVETELLRANRHPARLCERCEKRNP